MTLSPHGIKIPDPFSALEFTNWLVSGIRSAVHIGILAYGVLFICYLAARLIIGERWHVVAFVNNLLPWFCWMSMILTGIGLLYSDRWLLVGLQIPAIAAFGILYGSLFLPNQAPPAANGPILKVATFNICG